MSSPSDLAVAIVDDDQSILETLANYLSARGCIVKTARSGYELDALLSENRIDVVVLDLMMPGEDGLSICRRVAEKAPIIMLSAMGEVADRIVGLEMGASDYLAKPFDPRELLARIRSLARRPVGARPNTKRSAFAFEGWLLDADERKLVNPDGDIVALSAAEFDLLHVFVERPRRLLTRDSLLNATHGAQSDVFDRAIDVTISRLRKRLTHKSTAPLIETVRGEGYRFRLQVERL